MLRWSKAKQTYVGYAPYPGDPPVTTICQYAFLWCAFKKRPPYRWAEEGYTYDYEWFLTRKRAWAKYVELQLLGENVKWVE